MVGMAQDVNRKRERKKLGKSGKVNVAFNGFPVGSVLGLVDSLCWIGESKK